MLYILKSRIEYEGISFQGVFDSKDKAKLAIEYLKKLEGDTQKYVIMEIPLNQVSVYQCSDIFP